VWWNNHRTVLSGRTGEARDPRCHGRKASFRNRGIEERIPERSDSAATVEAKRLQARKFAEQLKLLNDARDLARKTIKELEAKEIAKNGC
jgi:hypothetical protein